MIQKLSVKSITGKLRGLFTVNSKMQTRLNRLPKRGMWVNWKTENKVGILTDLQSGDIATVMLVDPETGENFMQINCLGSEIRQAYFVEIPIARRPGEDVCAALGYYRG